jgi:hypothetical protein
MRISGLVMPSSENKSEPILARIDRDMLEQLGLLKCKSSSECYEIISKLTMRSLDRLKVMLTKYRENSGLFTPELRIGIKKNDLQAFAQVIYTLTCE